MQIKKILFAIVAVLNMAALGCARLDYVKVPTPTQYSTWTDADQRRADAMRGVRYYLPRPFLHLKEPVPVAQRVAFVSFVLEQDNNGDYYYKVQTPTETPTWLIRAVPERLSVTQVLAASLAQPKKDSGSLEDDEDNGSADNDTSADNEPNTRPPSELRARTGFISDTDPVTRLSNRMDIVYLPDFEEQYVIQPRTGLGQADIETRLRNGWAAEVFAQQVDNSNLIPYVIEQVESASDSAANIVTTWASTLATGGVANTNQITEVIDSVLENDDGGEERTSDERAIDFLGNIIVFKVAEIKMGQPGVYPILKPREVLQWLGESSVLSIGPNSPGSGRDPQEVFERYLKKADLPWIRPDMAFIPCPPFTMVGFNVTTDIYFAPVTERTEERNEGKDDGEGEGEGESESDVPTVAGVVSQLQHALEDKSTLENGDDLKDFLDPDGIDIEPSTATFKLAWTGKQDAAAVPDSNLLAANIAGWLNTVLFTEEDRLNLSSEDIEIAIDEDQSNQFTSFTVSPARQLKQE